MTAHDVIVGLIGVNVGALLSLGSMKLGFWLERHWSDDGD